MIKSVEITNRNGQQQQMAVLSDPWENAAFLLLSIFLFITRRRCISCGAGYLPHIFNTYRFQSIFHLKVVPTCLPARTELSTRKQKHGLMKRKLAQLQILLSDIGYITPLHLAHHSLWLMDKRKPSFLSLGKSSAELSKM